MKINVYPLLVAAILLVLSAPAALRAERSVLLGAENTIYELRQGTYADLFPEGTAAEAASGVLALDVVRADQSRERLLVPGTQSPEVESSQIMVYEPEGDALYLFWETVINGVHPSLYLTSFDGTAWGELFELLGTPFARKGSLQLVASRNAVATEVEGQGAMTVLHAFWSEERPGISVKRYAPIFIIDRTYLGWTPVYELESLITPAAAGAMTPISAGIADAVRAQVGEDRQKTVVGYLDPATRRLETLEIEILPSEIPSLADVIRAEIIPIGLRSGDITDLARGARELIFDLGADFHPATLVYMADRVEQAILSSDQELTEDGLAVMAEEIRQRIIEVGSTIGAGGLVEAAESRLIEVTLPGHDGHLLKVSSVSDREAPEVGGEASLWLSESGRDVLVTWEEGDRIFYRESVGDGWSEPVFLEVGPQLSREQIYESLAERARSR